jgi:acyl-coenzyme A thioesterase PaaI-like protein
MTGSELKELLVKYLPSIDDHGEVVEEIGEGRVRIRLPFREEYMGEDVWGKSGSGVFSGPVTMGLADTSMYGCILTAFGEGVIPVIVTFTINFLSPVKAADLIAESRIIRQGKNLVYLETYLYSDGGDKPVAHITSTYAVRDRQKS